MLMHHTAHESLKNGRLSVFTIEKIYPFADQGFVLTKSEK